MYQIGKTERQLLPRSDDRISYIYIEKGRIEQTEFSIQVVRGLTTSELPIATVDAIFLGPGTTITHEAIKTVCDVGCSIIWCGMEQWRFYAAGAPGTKSSKNLLKQMRYHESKTLHMQVVRDMYKLRYPDEHISRKSLSELRGIEGMHVKKLYEELAEQYSIHWSGRSYKADDFESQDDINRALTTAHQVLYDIIKSVLHLTGFSSAIGFIHTGNMDSFVYDMADLYKEKLSIPVAFETVSKNPVKLDSSVREAMRGKILELHLLKQIVNDLKMLFDCEGEDIKNLEQLKIWDPKENVIAGRNYAKKL